MNRLHLVNASVDIPFFIYDDDVENEYFNERSFRFNILRCRRNESKTNLEGAPPYFFKWVHIDEYDEHYDKPCLRQYVGLETVLKTGSYELVKFLNPAIFLQKLPATGLMHIAPRGTKSLELRRFNQTFVDFFNTEELTSLRRQLDHTLDDFARDMVIDLCISEEDSDSEFPSSPIGSFDDSGTDSSSTWISNRVSWSPPTDPRLSAPSQTFRPIQIEVVDLSSDFAN